MASTSSTLTYRRFRAAQGDGEFLLHPDGSEWSRHARQNEARLGGYALTIGGRSHADLMASGRRTLVAAAEEYQRDYRPGQVGVSPPIIMSGHQPELFHPGVWAKNFATAGLARALQGTAVHVIIDNDLVRQQAVAVPTGPLETPRVDVVAFNTLGEPAAHEVNRVRDPKLFASFGTRVTNRLRERFAGPCLLDSFWPLAQAAADANKPLGWAFSQARHQIELDWGIESVEVPLSALCRGEAFHWLVADWLLRSETVVAAFNRRLAEYRHVHRLRSAAQPIPDLRRVGEWMEAPLWWWTASEPVRRPLFLRRRAGDLLVGDEGHELMRCAADAPCQAVAADLARLADRGIAIRPRALTNTLFLRLLLSDLFVHGIGGGKYDQITDLLFTDLYGILPPSFAVLSQTTLLPVDWEPTHQEEIREKQQLARAMHFHPEVFLPKKLQQDHQVSSWVERKRQLVAQAVPKEAKKDRHLSLQQANAKLRGFLQEKPQELRKRIDELKQRAAVSKVWTSREWPAVLFPAEFLRTRLLETRHVVS